MSAQPPVARTVDAMLEATILLSFSRVGYLTRRRLFGWGTEDPPDLAGRRVVVTGGTSGIGLAAAVQLARFGADVCIVGRKEERNHRAVDRIRAAAPDASVTSGTADLGEPDQVEALAADLSASSDRIDVLIHNAGALSADYSTNSRGIETTVASQVLGPFDLTTLLLPVLSATSGCRVLTVSSGGMYTERLSVDRLEMDGSGYNGATAYARAKRAQVALNQEWAGRPEGRGIVFHAMHPGWADTPGLAEALPGFRTALGPLLRSPAEGADTLVWLASDGRPLQSSGEFWLDRRRRSTSYLPGTATDASERSRLWEWCRERTDRS